MKHPKFTRYGVPFLLVTSLAACASYDREEEMGTARLDGEGAASYRADERSTSTQTTSPRLGAWNQRTSVRSVGTDIGSSRTTHVAAGTRTPYAGTSTRVETGPGTTYGTTGSTAWRTVNDENPTYTTWRERNAETYPFSDRDRFHTDVNVQLDRIDETTGELSARTDFASDAERTQWNTRIADLERRSAELRAQCGPIRNATETQWSTTYRGVDDDLARLDRDVEDAWTAYGANGTANGYTPWNERSGGAYDYGARSDFEQDVDEQLTECERVCRELRSKADSLPADERADLDREIGDVDRRINDLRTRSDFDTVPPTQWETRRDDVDRDLRELDREVVDLDARLRDSGSASATARFEPWDADRDYTWDERDRFGADLGAHLDGVGSVTADLRARTDFEDDAERREWIRRLDDIDRRAEDLRSRSDFDTIRETEWDTRIGTVQRDVASLDADVGALHAEFDVDSTADFDTRRTDGMDSPTGMTARNGANGAETAKDYMTWDECKYHSNLGAQLDEVDRMAREMRSRNDFATDAERRQWTTRVDEIERRSRELRTKLGNYDDGTFDETARNDLEMRITRLDSDIQGAQNGWSATRTTTDPNAPSAGIAVGTDSLGVMGARDFRFENRDAYDRYVDARLRVLDDRLSEASRQGYSTATLATLRADLERHRGGLDAVDRAADWDARRRQLDEALDAYQSEFDRTIPGFRETPNRDPGARQY